MTNSTPSSKTADTEIHPFRIAIPQADLDDLQYRLSRTFPLWVIIACCIVLSSAAYIGLVKFYEGKMATIGDERFHVEAFKVKRPIEFRSIWSHFITKNDFTFDGLSDFVNIAFTNQGDSGHVDRIVAFTQGQVDQFKQSISELRLTIDSQEEVISSMKLEVELSENAVSYLVGLLKKINENLYRLTNDKLELHDMDFVTGFSLYRQVENQLHLILDKGTSGSGTGTLDLQNPGRPYAAVDAANSGTDEAFIHTPYPGRMVVAFRMKMLNEEVWVWSFHFDEDDERGLSLTLSNDIIESRQIRRTIHAFCLVLQKRMLFSKEVGLNASSK
jgi:hypothetical protein